VVQALIDDLIERGLDPAVPRLFIIDGSKALAKAIRHSFRHTPIQRCQIHKARNIVRHVTRNVKRWSSSSMALRWTAAAMNEAKKGFRRLKASPGVQRQRRHEHHAARNLRSAAAGQDLCQQRRSGEYVNQRDRPLALSATWLASTTTWIERTPTTNAPWQGSRAA